MKPRDISTDPEPGDVAKILPGWTRKVISVDRINVRFQATVDGHQFEIMTDSREMWSNSVRSQPAEQPKEELGESTE